MSDDFGLRGPKLPWACPNDRQLALRAKLKTGWSVKTNTFSQYPKPPPLSDREQQIIVSVVKRAEEYDLYEQQRVGKLVDRLDSLKQLANGNGTSECVLCGDTFGIYMFGRSNYKCHDCGKAVCRKCVVEITIVRHSTGKEILLRMCKVCSENRELIKKSGAWFFKGVPKYILPEKRNHYTNNFEKYAASPRSFQEQKYVNRYGNPDAGPSTSSNSNATEVSPSPSALGAVGGKPEKSCGKDATTTTSSSSSTTTTSSSSFASSISKSGIFFWTRSLRNRSRSSSQQTTSDQEQESSSDDGGIPNPLRQGAGAEAIASTSSAASGSGTKAQPPISNSPPNENGSSSQNGSGSGILRGLGSWSGLSLSRGQSPPVSRLRQSPSASRADINSSPVPSILTSTTGENETSQVLSGQETPVPSGHLGGMAEYRYSSSLDLSSSSSRQKSVEKFDFSQESEQQQQAVVASTSSSLASTGGATLTSAVSANSNGDNNARSSASSSTDCLFQQGASTSAMTNNSTPSISAASSTTSAAPSSSGQQQQSSASAAPLGVIQVALLYDDTHQALHCSVLHAKDLVPMDINGLTDPYCILKLIPSRFEGTHLRTKTVHKSVNPIYNETLTFYGVSAHDLTWQTLQILVMDDDRWGKDCLGTTQIPLHRLRSQQTRCFAQSLERGRLSEEKEWGRGRLLLSLTYLTEKSLLLVGVIQAQDLPALDHNGTSDPFVKVLLHDSNLGALSTSCFSSSSINRKFRTSVKWRTLNPEFREEFSLKVSIVDLPRLALVISVWDKDLGKNDDYIGGVVLSNGSKGDRLKHWMDTMKLPNTKHFKWHTLSPSPLPNH